MKKEYKKPNICAVDFEILDLILASEAVVPGGNEGGWELMISTVSMVDMTLWDSNKKIINCLLKILKQTVFLMKK
ncbi:MAG: hypothetical protein IJ883_02040 [Eubacterium sp.]|nr:hypothetical protein [Eubacterium sp.]